jgi:hypothetical protein
MKMRRIIRRAVVGSAAFLAVASFARAQAPNDEINRVPGSRTLIEKLNAEAKPSAPAPKRDLNGAWTGPVDSLGRNFPPFTPLGAERYKLNKPEPIYHLANTNDPLTTCDPLGFPRNIINETRGMRFAQLPDRMVVLHQYQKIWREVWTDGRELPKSIDTKEGAPSRWYGYSVGHWEGDYTFVIDSVGMDERTWLDTAGHPHSVEMRVQERYTRVDHDTLHMSVRIDDPKIYISPFEELTDVTFKWIPNQELDEQLCVPSEAIEYMKIIGYPNGNADSAK